MYFAPRTIKQKEDCGCENFVPRCGELGGSTALPAIGVSGLKISGLKATGSGKVCTCCDEDGPGIKKELSAGIEAGAEVSIPLAGYSKKVNFTSGNLRFSGDLNIGSVSLDLSGKLKGEYQLTEDCHGKNQRECFNAAAEATAELAVKLGPDV